MNPITHLLPFSNTWQIVWSYQWEINAGPNFVVTIFALGITFYYATRKGYSLLNLVSTRLDRVFVRTLQNRFKKTR